MLPEPKNYVAFPSVVLADTPTQITILPTEKAFLFFEGEEYEVTVIAVNEDEINYYWNSNHKTVSVIAHDGILRLSYTFKGEQEHWIHVKKDGKKLAELCLFSLYEDLYRLVPLKGDLHAHSFRSDGAQDPSALAGHFREQGYDFFALTDHNRYYPGKEIDETYRDVSLGITRIPGEEVHTPGSMVHIVHIGGEESVADRYIHNNEDYAREVEAYKTALPETIPSPLADRYARAKWAADKIHEAGGLAIFAHPYWRTRSLSYNVFDDFARLLLTSGMFDAFELVGGAGCIDNNRAVALWGELRAEGLALPVVASSDVHGLKGSKSFPFYHTVCFAEQNTPSSILQAIRSQKSVAVETTGTDYTVQNRCYGELRLVTYAQFLLAHYFPQRQRLCQGAGVAMRAYAMGAAPKELIECQEQASEKFTLQFFGKEEPTLPSQEILEFEERWRQVHLTEGPDTKGSQINTGKVTRQL